MTINQENLAMKKCPKCGYDQHFLVNVAWCGQVRLYDFGTEEMSGGHTEWDNSSLVQCPACDWEGSMGELVWAAHIPPILKSHITTILEYAQLSTKYKIHHEILEEMDLSNQGWTEAVEFVHDLLTEIS